MRDRKAFNCLQPNLTSSSWIQIIHQVGKTPIRLTIWKKLRLVNKWNSTKKTYLQSLIQMLVPCGRSFFVRLYDVIFPPFLSFLKLDVRLTTINLLSSNNLSNSRSPQLKTNQLLCELYFRKAIETNGFSTKVGLFSICAETSNCFYFNFIY